MKRSRTQSQGIKIVGGSLRGRTIAAPVGHTTRPTGHRVREALCQMLTSNYLPNGFRGLYVLDLFAGSGALAFESISRGAKHAICIDNDRTAIRTLRANTRDLAVEHDVTIIGHDLLHQTLPPLPHAPNLVWCDPPYDLDATPLLLRLHEQIAVRGLLCYEHAAHDRPVLLPHWRLLARRQMGVACVSIFRAIHDEPIEATP